MKLGIMQPYIFPYIGYFQLIAVVDRFVVHDDVQWIKGGWINRNRILVNGQPHYITFPCKRGLLYLTLTSDTFPMTSTYTRRKCSGRLRQHIRKLLISSRYSLCYPGVSLARKEISRASSSILFMSAVIIWTLHLFTLSSELEKRNELKAAERVIDINRVIGASHYINPIGGTELYDKAHFSEKDLHLSFIKTRNIPYKQLQNGEFVPFLSIIDVMMFNSKNEIAGLLGEYDLC